MTSAQLREYLQYYRDLGFETIYRVTPQLQPIVEKQSFLPPALPGLAPPGDTLALIRADIGDCKRCRLCEARHTIVFGSGNESSSLVFVGEGPGADEDAQGLPFVGRAGQLLTQMIENTGMKEGIPVKRSDVSHLQCEEMLATGKPHAAA